MYETPPHRPESIAADIRQSRMRRSVEQCSTWCSARFLQVDWYRVAVKRSDSPVYDLMTMLGGRPNQFVQVLLAKPLPIGNLATQTFEKRADVRPTTFVELKLIKPWLMSQRVRNCPAQVAFLHG